MSRSSALRAPATRDQADAYRFGVRRLESALAYGDAVPLHERARSQRRAAFAGVLLGLLGLCGAAGYALLVPTPDWRRAAVVVGSPSGAVYAVAHAPDRLVPVLNVPAARLVLAALREGGAVDADPAAVVASTVPDDELAGAPRTPTADVPGAVAATPGATVAARWAVCDRVADDGTLRDTTLIAAAAPVGPVAVGDGVLLTGDNGATWLVTAGQRHRVDEGDGALNAAMGLKGELPRTAATGVISLLPEGAPLSTPMVAGRGRPAPAGLPGAVGDVLASTIGDGAERYFVVLADGLQEVPKVVADLLVVASAARTMHPVGPDVLGGASYRNTVHLDGWPAGPVHLLTPADAAVVCWTWTPDRPVGDVWFGRDLPLPTGASIVELAQKDDGGDRLDRVAVGAGGAVRATGPGQAPGTGPVWLLSATGVAYGVADAATASALGVGVTEPAPDAALKLLPRGPALDLAAAHNTVDAPAHR